MDVATSCTVCSALCAVSTVLLSVIVVVIYFRQLRVSRSQLNLALFEQRYMIFEAGLAFLLHGVAPQGATDEACKEFLVLTAKVKWLFNEATALAYIPHIGPMISA